MKQDVKEEWKNIPDFLNIQASNLGRIRLAKENEEPFIYSTFITNKGYKRVAIYKNKSSKQKKYAVHRLVALTWIPNPDNLPQVNHKDGNKLNNAIGNLEWTTGSDNVNHAFDNNLRIDNIELNMFNIITNEHKRYRSIKEASEDLKISNGALLAGIRRSKQFPIEDKYVFDISDEYLDRMINTTRTQSIPIYVYDHIDKTMNKCTSVAHASVYTSINHSTIAKGIEKSKDNIFYTGGYTFSYDIGFIPRTIILRKAKKDRKYMWSRPIIKYYEGYIVYDYENNKEIIFRNNDKLSKYLGIKTSIISDVIRHSRDNKRTGLIRGYGLKPIGDNTEWHKYTEKELQNSKKGYRINMPIIEIVDTNVKRLVFGVAQMAMLLQASFDEIRNALRYGGNDRFTKLANRANMNVSIRILD